jgi:CRISPR-associated protein Csb1
MFDLKTLSKQPRLLFDVTLRPVQGQRFQPTGFPDLGAATYTLPDRTEMLLVESAQSMANRLESTAWDQVANDLIQPLRGLPYIATSSPSGKFLTSSVLEAHRLNSPYFLDSEGGKFLAQLKSDLEAGHGEDPEAVDLRHAAAVVFKFDPNSLLHGVFLANSKLAGGRYRFVRSLSAFIEAEDVRPVESGGVKNDRVNPSGDAKTGYGNVPFHRTEFVASSITAHFALDLATLRGYGLGEAPENLLVMLALWKIRTLLAGNLRLRTACDLVCGEADGIAATVPGGFVLPSAEELAAELPGLIAACAPAFAKPPVTRLTWSAKEAKSLAAERTKKETEDEEGAK